MPKRIKRQIVSGVERLHIPKRMRQIRFLSSNLRPHHRYVGSLASCARIVSDVPIGHLRYKYLRNYLVRDWSFAMRRDAISEHYRFLAERREAFILDQGRHGRRILWESDASQGDEPVVAVSLSRSRVARFEGESEISVFLGQTRLATLSFTFACGAGVGADRQTVCLIGSLQGTVDTHAETKRAAGLMMGLSPFKMLIVALKMVAAALGFDDVHAVSAGQQVALCGEISATGLDYDKLWTAAGATQQPNAFFRLSTKTENRSLAHLSSAHRRRAARRREAQERIASDIARRLGVSCGRDTAAAIGLS